VIAVKLAYDGTRFFGSQIQSDRPTIEGELRKYFYARLVSRTDRWVSALGNVAFVDEDILLRQYSFEDIWLYAKAKRWKKPFKKRYVYFLLNGGDSDLVQDACRTLSGTHDFFNFCKRDRTKEVDYTKTITIRPVWGECMWLEVTGESFLWQMIRRLVAAITLVGTEKMTIEELKTYLTQKKDKKIPPAPPEYLLLVDIEGFDFSYDSYLLKRVIEHFEKRYRETFLKSVISSYSLQFLRKYHV
jgi:tRNA pseudouridine38-40 synthase